MINVPITFDEAYEFIKLYDTLRDMDFELTNKQQSVFEKIQEVKNDFWKKKIRVKGWKRFN